MRLVEAVLANAVQEMSTFVAPAMGRKSCWATSNSPRRIYLPCGAGGGQMASMAVRSSDESRHRWEPMFSSSWAVVRAPAMTVLMKG